MEILIGAVVVGLGAWTLRRLAERRAKPVVYLDADADIAHAVATHEAGARATPLAPLHVLYGLLQIDQVTAAIEGLGGDPRSLESRVLDELERGDRVVAPAGQPSEGELVIAYAIVLAQGHERLASCTDLWRSLLARGATKPFEDASLTGVGVLFALAHGHPEPRVAPVSGYVDLVLHDDDYTTKEIVVAILREVFELDEPQAIALMTQAHDSGRAIIGCLPVSVARPRIEAGQQRARERGYPLWIEAVARS